MVDRGGISVSHRILSRPDGTLNYSRDYNLTESDPGIVSLQYQQRGS